MAEIIKLNVYETHDRYEHLLKQNFNISECCQDLINQRPFGNHSFYIFAHARTCDDGVTKKLIWQPRLTKPLAQSNSMLFKAYPGTDIIKIIWLIPAPELWEQYKKGNVTESNIVSWSIHQFLHNRKELEQKESDDLSDEQIDDIYLQISRSAKPYKPILN